MLGGLSSSTNPNLAPPYSDVAMLLLAATLLHRQETIDDQIDMWNDVYGGVLQQVGTAHADDPDLLDMILDAWDYVNAVLSLLSGYEQRQRPVRWLGLDAYQGAIGKTNTALVEGVLHSTSVEWGDDGLVQADDAGPGETAADYLADLRERFEDRNGSLPESGLGRGFLDRQPLLYQLLDRTLQLVPTDPGIEQSVVEALDELATLDPETLEWLLRETLGLGTHRLDAWNTSLAAERLSRLRDARPEGIQIGAFGWVTELDPRETDRLSAGFVHAPSLAHATTAAMLRSGWHAHGTDDQLSPVAVNLDSARVRTASWLLDGVRQGQDLGDLLGYRFERALHDLGADEDIRSVREQVLVATDRADVPPDAPVDGIELLDVYRAAGLTEITSEVQSALDEIEGAFDAVNDLGLFESVHQLATGNLERATAMLDALSTGERAPPELRAPRTPRAGVPIEHRVVVLLDPEADEPQRGWAAGVRDAVAPALETWIASLLPTADTVGFAVRPVGTDGKLGAAQPLTLAKLGLSALDALWLVGDDPASVPAPLRTLAASRIETKLQVRIDPADRAGAKLALREFSVLAVELRRAVDSLRVADARDLRPAHTPGEADTDDAAALAAVEGLIVKFGGLVDDLDDAVQAQDANAIASIAEWMARVGLSAGAAPADVASAGALHTLAVRRLAAVGHAAAGVTERRPRLERQLAALLGGRVPILGTFPIVAAEGGDVVDLTAGLAGRGGGRRLAGRGWSRAARSRPADRRGDAERAAHARRRAACVRGPDPAPPGRRAGRRRPRPPPTRRGAPRSWRSTGPPARRRRARRRAGWSSTAGRSGSREPSR